ncbi:malto-oligosyltrehalose synthase [Chitinophaga pendula]|uniref:malto-oligosyltrehalose synthase n=1 Tax=Chitinophaga TaxID=79328 RepID=UPI000BB0113F|nr:MULTISPECIES: malto-oligosyltrehalose synthase [Chitinophaga]ASZ13462.1 malto-oligosyltrehalose synthase [Chitinophaga sp. MD30]UCJ08911.1 malto-oligosyltrehalose synthase [Chitinophaga pendula]
MKSMMMYNPTHTPIATYRLQLNEHFTFRDVHDILDYLHALGVSTIYASPVLGAVKGSTHGYDGTDPHQVSPAIGTLEEWRALSARLKERGMSWLQDIVPNHLAYDADNPRLMDVMERGPLSPYYRYFDINWEHPSKELHGKLQLPFLDKPLAECIAEGRFQLRFTSAGYVLQCGEQAYPLSMPAYELLLQAVPAITTAAPFGELVTALQEAAEQSSSLQAWQAAKQQLIVDFTQQQGSDTLAVAVAETVNISPSLLPALLDKLYYHWEYWRKTESEINYRRFFTVNQLITLRMEEEAVFDEYHTFLAQLYREGLIQGMRIDHIDGLQEPGTYIRRLRRLLGDDLYLIAEKILEGAERLPADWALQGSSGYDFLATVNQLLTDGGGAQKLLRFYRCLSAVPVKYERLVREQKELILSAYMGGEWENLVHDCYTLGLADGSYTRDQLKAAIGLFMVCMPVYRAYPEDWPLSAVDQQVIRSAFDKAAQLAPLLSPVLEMMAAWWHPGIGNKDINVKGMVFLKRLMQFTGPLTAKGVEDTAFYIYHPLISHNEVGDTPGVLGKLDARAFHAHMVERQAQHPFTMNATSTHDTKRGEDARIRLNMLTLLADKWIQQVQTWHSMNAACCTRRGQDTIPGLNEEYLIYQSLIGSFPIDGLADITFIERFCAFLVKALREGKAHTNWSEPNVDYENACTSFVQQLLSPEHPFLDSFVPFLEQVKALAVRYSLAQVLLRITAPGIPDLYQGAELWELSFVDPDNRRPVNYRSRQVWLSALIEKEREGYAALLAYLEAHAQSGVEKLYVTWKALQYRRAHAQLFLEGSYVPLSTTDDAYLAYARRQEDQWCIVVCPLPCTPVQVVEEVSSLVLLPEGAPLKWCNLFTGEEVEVSNGGLSLSCLQTFPVALLTPMI